MNRNPARPKPLEPIKRLRPDRYGWFYIPLMVFAVCVLLIGFRCLLG